MIIKKKILIWILLVSCMSMQKTYSMDNKYIGWGLGVGAAVCFVSCVYTCGTGIVIRKIDCMNYRRVLSEEGRKASNYEFRKGALWGIAGMTLASAFCHSRSRSLPVFKTMPEL